MTTASPTLLSSAAVRTQWVERVVVRPRGADTPERSSSDQIAPDQIAVEQPLEMRLRLAGEPAPGSALSVTMRTPGHDEDLTMGFLFGEGVIRGAADVLRLTHCGPSSQVIVAELAPGVSDPRARLQRHFFTTSSCGVCGKSSIDAVLATVPKTRSRSALRLDARILVSLPAALVGHQRAFAVTGGMHAAALFNAQGDLLAVREDVGRHNATDKLIGARLRAGLTDFADCVLLLSGRASFELLQKAAVAGIPIVAAIGAPSSLAIELATEAGITLVGFLRDGAFNIYSARERVQQVGAA